MRRGHYEAIVIGKSSEWTRIKAGSMTAARAQAAQWVRSLDWSAFWRNTSLDCLYARVVVVAWDGERATDEVRVDRPLQEVVS